MADIDQFILVVTNEAMDRVCYSTTDGTGGWKLSPYQFAISDTDVLAGYTDEQIFDDDGQVRDEIYNLLKNMTTQNMKDDENKIWCELPFSGLTKLDGAGNTLSHHVVIPSDHPIAGDSKDIKTIYFIYTDMNGVQFLYALARANTHLIYETGLTQKYFFNFTVANAHALDSTEFVVNYSYPLEIQAHNTNNDAHDQLVARDGSRTLTALLNYDSTVSISADTGVTHKKYVDDALAALKAELINMMSDLTAVAIPPGTLYWWPGQASTIPDGWTIRDGRELSISQNPKLYNLIGTRYNNGAETSGYFRIMDDRGLFIRGTETDSTGAVVNDNLLSGILFGQKQTSAIPNLKGSFSGHNASDGTLFKHGSKQYWHGNRNDNGNKRTISFNANNYNSIYQDGVKEARPNNRNYIPIIKLG